MVEPITPAQARKAKGQFIPEAVIAAFNTLIVKAFDGTQAIILQDDIVSDVLARTSTSRHTIFEKGWLDVETIYEDMGWKVAYEKPGYNETGRAQFTFTARSSKDE